MKAMLLKKITDLRSDQTPLELDQVPEPTPGDGQVLVQVLTCGVCHTEMDEIEGRTSPPNLPVIPGHQVIGRVVETGPNVTNVKTGQRVGVAWINSACGHCEYCLSGQENLCNDFQATGRDVDGGYAEYMTVRADFVHPIPEVFSDLEAAPLLCAGAIGYRSLRLTNLEDGQSLGLTGFGSSGHLTLQAAKHMFPNSKIYVFSRNPDEQAFARELGATWAGKIEARTPEPLHGIIDTTPVWKPVVEAMANLRPGGRLVINAIRKEDVDKESLLDLDYSSHLWMEKEIKSVANLTRQDVTEFLELAAEIPLKPEVQEFGLEEANQALHEMKTSKIRGAKVLRIES
jgi:propanol-preferring alcohol dehydrogenase